MNRTVLTSVLLGCAGVLFSGSVWAQGIVIDQILEAHGASLLPPVSVQITGTVERGGKTEAFRITATRDEELRIDYGTEGKDTQVISPKATFHSDGEKISGSTSANYAQLDLTGLFFIAQLRNRAVLVEMTDEWLAVSGTRARRIRIDGDRQKNRVGLPRIEDRADIYVTEAGLLAGIARAFHQGRPDAYTAAYAFSDYRKTGDVLLPYRIEGSLNGERRLTFQVEQYSFDVTTSRDQFLPEKKR